MLFIKLCQQRSIKQKSVVEHQNDLESLLKIDFEVPNKKALLFAETRCVEIFIT